MNEFQREVAVKSVKFCKKQFANNAACIALLFRNFRYFPISIGNTSLHTISLFKAILIFRQSRVKTAAYLTKHIKNL